MTKLTIYFKKNKWTRVNKANSQCKSYTLSDSIIFFSFKDYFLFNYIIINRMIIFFISNIYLSKKIIIGTLWWDSKTTSLITKASYPTLFSNFPSSLLFCFVTCLSDTPTLSFSLHSLIGVFKKTKKPIKPRKPEKKITEKTEPWKKTD
jgi:hypothetical protein